MSANFSNTFTKENLDTYLKELAKEFRKLNGTTIPAEIILIGGAAVLTNYGFRENTMDVDAVIHASSAMKEAINHVGDKYNLPTKWLNDDFIRTTSYSPKLIEYSKYYKKFSNVLEIRTISAEYLIAMKLRAGRKYKNDLSDIVGILAEHQKSNSPISQDKINTAVKQLYGGWDDFSKDSIDFFKSIYQNGDFDKIYQTIKNEEKSAKEILLDFEGSSPNVTNQSNVDSILENLKKRKKDK